MAKQEAPTPPDVSAVPATKELPDKLIYHIYPQAMKVLEIDRTISKKSAPDSDGVQHSETIKTDGVNLQFRDGAARCPGRFVEKLKKDKLYKVQFVFAEDLAGHEQEDWAKHFIRQVKHKREIMHLPPLPERGVVMPSMPELAPA